MVSFPSLGPVVRRTDVLPPGGSVHEETDVGLSAALAAGWARAACSGPVKASLLFRQYDNAGVAVAEAGVNAAAVAASRFVTFAEQAAGQPGTGVAYANPSDTAEAVVTFTAKDAAGRTLDSFDQTLMPGGHGAQTMAGLFGLSSFTGSLEITSTEPIVSLSINAEAAPIFSSLPAGELDPSAQGQTMYYFPHLAVGASWQTTITYINYSAEEVSCQTDFLSDQGTPLLVSFPGGGRVDNRTDVLPPGGSVHEETDVGLSAPFAAGWARAACSGPVKASLLFRQYGSAGAPTGEAGVNAAAAAATRFVTFAEQAAGQTGTGVAYANPSDYGGGRGHLYGQGRGGADAGQRRSSPDAWRAWRTNHGGPVRSPQLQRDRSKSPPSSPSSVCRSMPKPLPFSPPCLRGIWMLLIFRARCSLRRTKLRSTLSSLASGCGGHPQRLHLHRFHQSGPLQRNRWIVGLLRKLHLSQHGPEYRNAHVELRRRRSLHASIDVHLSNFGHGNV